MYGQKLREMDINRQKQTETSRKEHKHTDRDRNRQKRTKKQTDRNGPQEYQLPVSVFI